MCGFVGMVALTEVAPSITLGLSAIQHRGQDAAGIGTTHEGRLHLVKDTGRVDTVLTGAAIQTLPGTIGIGHVRYPTHGGGLREDAQPFVTRRPGMVLAHNGNVTNVPQLIEQLRGRGIQLLSSCDSEPILMLLVDEFSKLGAHSPRTDHLIQALRVVMEDVRGSYTVVATLELDGQPTLIAFRDPHGIRPGVYGKREDGAWICASESVALDVLDAPLVGTVPPGGLVIMRHGEDPEIHEINPKQRHPCVFESIYFARPDSVLDGTRVNRTRGRLGQQLAEEVRRAGLEVDVVVAVPDTSRPAAVAISEVLGIPHREGFIKNRYSGRTFIMPDQAAREAAMRLKLNPIDEVFRNRKVLLVDDSIVRGTTMNRIVRMCRRHEPQSIHVAIFSPPVRHPCFYGIDMPSQDELVATNWPENTTSAQLARQIGADSVTFLGIQSLHNVTSAQICDACFTGNYVVDVHPSEQAYIQSDRRRQS